MVVPFVVLGNSKRNLSKGEITISRETDGARDTLYGAARPGGFDFKGERAHDTPAFIGCHALIYGVELERLKLGGRFRRLTSPMYRVSEHGGR